MSPALVLALIKKEAAMIHRSFFFYFMINCALQSVNELIQAQ